MATEFTKLVFKEEKTSAQWPTEAQILNIWFFSARNPESKLDLQFWYPLIFIHSKFRRDYDHEWYKQMKSSQNIQIKPHQIYFLFFGFCAKNVGASKWFTVGKPTSASVTPPIRLKTITQGQIIITHQVSPIIVIGIDVCLPWRLQNKPYMRDKYK